MSTLTRIRQQLSAAGLDYSLTALAELLQDQWPEAPIEGLQLALLLQKGIQEGDVCLEIDRVAARARELGFDELAGADLQALVESTEFVGGPDTVLPLIEDLGRFYLQRLHHQERVMAGDLLQRAGEAQALDDSLIQAVNRRFPGKDETDYQKLAVIQALRYRFLVISGGPGTGKTWTVARLIHLLLEQNPDTRIALAAPTGKAAARMSESLGESLVGLPAELRNRLPDKAVTLHRLLRIDYRSHRARHNREHPLPCDVLILDEASMIDQNLMYAVCEALPPQSRLILLGDKDQLASVEAGSVFADLCGGLQHSGCSAESCHWLQQEFGLELPPASSDYPLAEQVVVLQKSRRFGEGSGIGKLARCINAGDVDGFMEILGASDGQDDLEWAQPDAHAVDDRYREIAREQYQSIHDSASVGEALQRFQRFRILAAQWQGPMGVHHINACIEQWLKQQNGFRAEQELYEGKPLMITRNVHQYGLHNGDIGMLWRDSDGELRFWIDSDEGGLQAFSLAQLPPHETAYAMTVHKSQGSEFDRVLLVLPERENELCTRELLYTGITRARESVRVWGGEAVLRRAVQRATRRSSGLRQRLMSAAEARQ